MTTKSIEATRPHIWQTLRSHSRKTLLAYPLPKVNPDTVSFLSVCMAGLAVFAFTQSAYAAAWLFLALNLLFDGLDGAIAEKFHLRRTKSAQRHGEFVDLVTDRASELILFAWSPIAIMWLPLGIINSVLAFVQYKTRHALVIPLRLIFFLIFTVSAAIVWLR